MNRTDFRSWEPDQPPRWSDPPMSSSAWGAEAMEWETNLLLPQLVSALEHPAGPAKASTPAPASRPASLWRALQTRVRPTRWSRALLAN